MAHEFPKFTTTSAPQALKLGFVRALCQNSEVTVAALIEAIKDILTPASKEQLKINTETDISNVAATSIFATKSDNMTDEGVQLTPGGVVDLHNYLKWLEKQEQVWIATLNSPHHKTAPCGFTGSAMIAGVGDIAWKSSTPLVALIVVETLYVTGLFSPAELSLFLGEFAAIGFVLPLAALVIGPCTKAAQFELARETLEAERKILINAEDKITLNTDEPGDSDSELAKTDSQGSSSDAGDVKAKRIGDEYKKEVHSYFNEQLKQEQFSADDSGRAIRDIWWVWMLGFEAAKLVVEGLKLIALNLAKTALMFTIGPWYYALALLIVCPVTVFFYGNNKENDFWRSAYYEKNEGVLEEALTPEVEATLAAKSLNVDESGITQLEKNVAQYVGESISSEDAFFKTKKPENNCGISLKLCVSSAYCCVKDVHRWASSKPKPTLSRVEKLLNILEANNQLPTGCHPGNKTLFAAELARQLRGKFAGDKPENSAGNLDSERKGDIAVERNKIFSNVRQRGLNHMQALVASHSSALTSNDDESQSLLKTNDLKGKASLALVEKYKWHLKSSENTSDIKAAMARSNKFKFYKYQKCGIGLLERSPDDASNMLMLEAFYQHELNLEIVEQKNIADDAPANVWFFSERRATSAMHNKEKENESELYDEYKNNASPKIKDGKVGLAVGIAFLLIPFADELHVAGLFLKTLVTGAFAYGTTKACSYCRNKASAMGISMFGNKNTKDPQKMLELRAPQSNS
jgi:hypothetical protein